MGRTGRVSWRLLLLPATAGSTSPRSTAAARAPPPAHIIRRGRAPDSHRKLRGPAAVRLRRFLFHLAAAASPLTRQPARARSERASCWPGRPCARQRCCHAVPRHGGRRLPNDAGHPQPARAAADQSNQAGSYKEVPLFPNFGCRSPICLVSLSRSRHRSSPEASPNCPRASDPIPFAASSTTPRYTRVSPWLSHRFYPRKRSAVDSRFDWSPLELPVGVDFGFSCRFCCFCHVCFGSRIRIGGLIWFKVIQHIIMSKTTAYG